MSAKRHQTGSRTAEAWAGPWLPWGMAVRCQVFTPKGVVCEVRVVEHGRRVSSDGPTAEPAAVARVYAEVLEEAVRIIAGESFIHVSESDVPWGRLSVDGEQLPFEEEVDRG